jgi:uncharacterized membrane protein
MTAVPLPLSRRLHLPFAPVFGFLAAVFFLAGAIHICVILLVPAYSETDGWSRLAASAGDEQFAEIPAAGGATAVAGLDPLFISSACRVRLADAPASIAVDARDRFWSLALYDPDGLIVFSLNDRTAIEGHLDMLVVSPEQNAQLRRSPPADIEQRIVVESPSDDLVALLRLYAPTETARADARRILAATECVAEPLGGA